MALTTELKSLLPAVAVAALVSHQWFRRHEPTLPIILQLSAILFVAIAVHALFVAHANGVATILSDAATGVSVYLLTLATSISFYRIIPYWHPLGKIPGPILARWSQFYALSFAHRGKWAYELTRLHQRYGPIVRVGPNYVSVSSPAALRPIGRMPKAQSYSAAFRSGASLPREPDNAIHQLKRQVYNQAFTPIALAGYRPFMDARIAQFLDLLDSQCDRPINFMDPLNRYVFDLMNDFGFGGGWESMKGQPGAEQHIHDITYSNADAFTAAQLWWIMPVLRLFGPPTATGNLMQFAKKQFLRRKAMTPDFRDVFSWFIATPDDDGPQQAGQKMYRFSDAELAAEAFVVVVTGSDTTTRSTSLLLFHMVENPYTWTKLRAEIDLLTNRTRPPVDKLDLDALKAAPYLNACLKEVLRLYPAVQSGSRREVTAEGASFEGHYLPPGTDVVVPLGAMQRDPRYYSPEPNAFRPERWLKNEADKWHTDAEAFAPFSVGRRDCVGRNVAWQTMWLTLASLVLRFDLHFAPGFSPEAFKASIHDHFIINHAPLELVVSRRLM